MSEEKVASKYIDKDPPMGTEQQLERKNNDYLAYLKEKLNFILATYGRRLTDADGHVNELIRTAAEFAIRLSQKVNGDEIISAINASPEEITIQSNRINLVGVTVVNGKMVATYTRVYNHNDYSQADIDKVRAYVLGTGTLTDEDWDKYDINEDGVIRMSDLIVIRNMILNAADILKTVVVTIDPASGKPINIQTTCTGSSNWTATSYIAARHIDVGGIKCTGINSSEKVETPQVESRHSTGALSYKLNEDGLTFYDDANQVIGSYPKTGTNAGSDVVAGQGTTDGWVWRRWSSGVWEGWKTVSVTLSKSSGWAAWGNIFQSATIKRQSLPVTLAAGHYEFVTSHATQDWSSWAVVLDPPTTTQTGSYILCRGTRPSDTAVFALDYYVRGVVA